VNVTRRAALWTGGAFLAGLGSRLEQAESGDVVEIIMRGNSQGSRVWFDPIGVLVKPGHTVRWTNKDPSNSHTSTAYHPANGDHPLRIPAEARPWDSGYLLPDQSFEAVLNEPGIYDYFCVPHEHAGMVGRLVVAEPGASASPSPLGSPIEGIEEDPFPPVADIVRRGRLTLSPSY
jgi:plastocyanin